MQNTVKSFAKQILPTKLPLNEAISLPSTLAGLLSSAVNDAAALDRNIYQPYAGHWHTARHDSSCQVCLAGCLIAASLNNESSRTILPRMFSATTERKLDIVDSLREGDWLHAFKLLYRHQPNESIVRLMHNMQDPLHRNFLGWEEFDDHLQSLRDALPWLRAIDRQAADHGFLSFDSPKLALVLSDSAPDQC